MVNPLVLAEQRANLDNGAVTIYPAFSPFFQTYAKLRMASSTGHSNSSDLMAPLWRCNAKDWKTQVVCAAEKRVVDHVEGWAVAI